MRAGLVVTALAPRLVHVDAVEIDDRRYGVEEGEILFARMSADGFRELDRGEWTRRDDDAVPVFGRNVVDGFANDRDVRMGFERRGDVFRETFAVDCQGAASRHRMLAALGDDQAIGPAHFFMQHADSVGCMIVGAERVGADEFCQLVGLVGLGSAHAAHLMDDDGHAHVRGLPGCFGPGHAAANDVDRFDAHSSRCAASWRQGQADAGIIAGRRGAAS